MEYKGVKKEIEKFKKLFVELSSDYSTTKLQSIKVEFDIIATDENYKNNPNVKKIYECFEKINDSKNLKKALEELFEKIKNLIILTPEINILIQAYATSSLLLSLKQNDFLKSNYYNDANFILEDGIREIFKQINIDNQGCLLMILYSMLVIPKEKFLRNFKDNFNLINEFINENKNIKKSSTDGNKIKKDTYVKHLRNSISHGSIEFIDKNIVVFKDENPKTKNIITIEIPLSIIPELLSNLHEIIGSFINDIRKIQLYK